jgi:glycosyltransferase involved in cell wall biosynthesis
LLVGGKEEQVKEMKEKAQCQGVSDYFIFTGTVPFDAVADYIDIADVLVSPRTKGSNTPLKIYSYLKSGKPIVATNLLTHTQVLNHDVAVLTEPTAKAFAEGILLILNDGGLRSTLSQNAKKLAEEKYSYSIYLEKTREVLEAVHSN